MTIKANVAARRRREPKPNRGWSGMWSRWLSSWQSRRARETAIALAAFAFGLLLGGLVTRECWASSLDLLSVQAPAVAGAPAPRSAEETRLGQEIEAVWQSVHNIGEELHEEASAANADKAALTREMAADGKGLIPAFGGLARDREKVCAQRQVLVRKPDQWLTVRARGGLRQMDAATTAAAAKGAALTADERARLADTLQLVEIVVRAMQHEDRGC